MTCAEFKELAPGWALGALDTAELEACEAHLATPRLHEGCEAVAIHAEEAASLLVASLPAVAVPEAVWDGIEHRLFDQTTAAVPVLRSRVAGITALAASVAVVALSIGHHFGREEVAANQRAAAVAAADAAREQQLTRGREAELGGQIEECRRVLKTTQGQVETQQKALGLLGEPSTEVVALTPQADFRSSGSLIFNASKRQAMVVVRSLSPAADRDYELWVIRGKDKIPAGLLKVEPNGSTLAQIDDKLLQQKVDLIAITLEPAGGGPAPRGPLVLLATVKKG